MGYTPEVRAAGATLLVWCAVAGCGGGDDRAAEIAALEQQIAAHLREITKIPDHRRRRDELVMRVEATKAELEAARAEIARLRGALGR